MYMVAKATKKPRWTIASARQRLPALISSAAREPQAVYRRDQLVATVVGPDAAEELKAARERPRVAEALAELRELCREEAYELPVAPRADRRSPVGRRAR
jgi:hypothetical protein